MPKRSAEVADIAGALALLDALYPGAFRLDTCQRTLWIFPSLTGPLLTGGAGVSPALIPGAQIFAGPTAYQFLLEVATGLQSEVQGETDIFGQLKEAWAAFESSQAPLLAALKPWVLKLFEDTKEIRASHLQHVGGSSYGSLVRKLIRGFSQSPQEPILLLGAGRIAQSIAPWLVEQELWIWNRSRASLEALVEELGVKAPGARIRVILDAEEEARALREAAHLVVCIPFDPECDERRIALWNEGNRTSDTARSVIHLGGLRQQCGAWKGVDDFHALDEIFALQKAQGDTRSEQIARAFRACAEKARLRSLPGSLAGSLTLPHGWEDLAVFA